MRRGGCDGGSGGGGGGESGKYDRVPKHPDSQGWKNDGSNMGDQQ